MTKLIPLFILTIHLSGCATEAKMVLLPGSYSESQYAPVNEELRPGIVKYRSEGPISMVQKQRDDAYRKMFQACSGKYKILNESVATESHVSGVGEHVSATVADYVAIQFECVK